jgi:Tubulin-tyrosine ligase family
LQACYAAFRERALTPTNAVSCTPGTEVITGKAAFVSTLNNAYGPATASTVMPTAFLLPQQYNEFANHIYATHAAGNWALKEDVHRGKGVVAAPSRRGLRQALEKVELKKKGPKAHRFVMAQRFIDDQMLISNRPFVMRLWASFAGGNPLLQGHLYSGGIAIFGSEHQSQKKNSTNEQNHGNGTNNNDTVKNKNDVINAAEEEEQRVQNLVVNIFQQNRSAAIDPWSISDIKAHLRKETGSDIAFSRMWDVVERSTAAALAAAVPSVRRTITSSRLRRYQGGNIELLGLDFVIDSSIRPWLVEVNYLPSMARKVIDCVPPSTDVEKESKKMAAEKSNKVTKEVCRGNPMDLEKEAFLRSYLRVIAARHAGLEDNIVSAQTAVEKLQNTKKETKNGRLKCTVTADFLRQILDAENEWHAAKDNGFSDLTGHIYESLECLAGNAAACAAALPPPAMTQNVNDTTAATANLSFSQRLLLNLEWGMAQVRRVGLGIDRMLKLLKGPRRRPSAPPLRYIPLSQDALAKAWLRLPIEKRKGRSAESVLEELCALERSIIYAEKAMDEESATSAKDEL